MCVYANILSRLYMTIEEHSLEIALNTGAPAGIAMFPMLMMMMVMMMMVLPQ